VVAESFSPTGVGDPTLVNHFAIAQKRILSERRYCGNGFSSLKSAKGIKSFLFLQALGNATRILLGPRPALPLGLAVRRCTPRRKLHKPFSPCVELFLWVYSFRGTTCSDSTTGAVTRAGETRDPLANLKRLDENRPGFHWRATPRLKGSDGKEGD